MSKDEKLTVLSINAGRDKGACGAYRKNAARRKGGAPFFPGLALQDLGPDVV